MAPAALSGKRIGSRPAFSSVGIVETPSHRNFSLFLPDRNRAHEGPGFDLALIAVFSQFHRAQPGE